MSPHYRKTLKYEYIYLLKLKFYIRIAKALNQHIYETQNVGGSP
jgi:hypothetical protein